MQIHCLFFNVQVTRTRGAEAAALRRLRQQWPHNFGGGREWFLCPRINGILFLLHFEEPFSHFEGTQVDGCYEHIPHITYIAVINNVPELSESEQR